MSGQDDKFVILDRAKAKYTALKKLMECELALPLPEPLRQAIAEYEKMGAVYNSSVFENALEKYWREITASDKIKSELEVIVNYQLD